MAGFTAVHDVCFGDIDLLNRWIELLSLLLQALNGIGGEIHHVIGDILIQLRLGFGFRFDGFTQLEAQRGFFIVKFVKSFFQLVEVVPLFRSVRKFNWGELLLVFRQVLFFAVFGRGPGFGLDVVGECIHVGSTVGEDSTHREQPSVHVAKLFVDCLGLGC